MIAHIDTVDILIGYTTGKSFQHDTISVQVLVPPHIMVWDILLWQELFTDLTLFPHPKDASISNAKILKFLDVALESSSKAKVLNMIWVKQDL